MELWERKRKQKCKPARINMTKLNHLDKKFDTAFGQNILEFLSQHKQRSILEKHNQADPMIKLWLLEHGSEWKTCIFPTFLPSARPSPKAAIRSPDSGAAPIEGLCCYRGVDDVTRWQDIREKDFQICTFISQPAHHQHLHPHRNYILFWFKKIRTA